jgi:muramidase (phage lysozyme)
MHPNRKAFLDMLAFSEGTRTGQHKLTKNDGYDVIVTAIGGVQSIFTDYSSHPFAADHPSNGGKRRPSLVINSRGLTSNAAGRQQFMLRDWDHYRKLLQLDDFGPAAQDAWAIQLIRERHALPLIDMGNFKDAVNAVRSLWASLPGAGHNQHENDINRLETAYLSFGGQLA